MLFDRLIQSASEKLKELDFYPLDDKDEVQGGERHGGREWTWAKRGEEGHYYTSFGAVELTDDTYRMEVWTGSDKGVRFGRYLVREFPNTRDSDLAGSGLDQILASLQEAAKRATTLPDEVLTGTYIR